VAADMPALLSVPVRCPNRTLDDGAGARPVVEARW
jgi:hypothetical protein